MGAGGDYFSCTWARLGYLSLDSNERSAFKARELKSVYLKKRGAFLKLLFHRCHINSLNLYNQVGLIAINVLGTPDARVAPHGALTSGYDAPYGGGGGGGGGVPGGYAGAAPAPRASGR